MPNVVEELSKTARSRFFALVDFVHRYWQLLLALASKECQSFVTHENVFSPNRVLHGTKNAVLQLQAFLTKNLPVELKLKALLWVDYLMFHGEIEHGLIDNFAKYLRFFDAWNINLNPTKCVLFKTEAKWCGRA